MSYVFLATTTLQINRASMSLLLHLYFQPKSHSPPLYHEELPVAHHMTVGCSDHYLLWKQAEAWPDRPIILGAHTHTAVASDASGSGEMKDMQQ